MRVQPTATEPNARRERAWSRHGLLAMIALAAGTVLAAVSQAPATKVLVVNSDGGVEKYATAQQAFRESFVGPVTALNLAGLSDRAAERAIRAEAPTAIYSIGTKASVAASRASKGRPIVMSSVINWQRLPAAAAAGTHVIANELPSAAQVTMFRYFFPKVKRIGVLYSAEFNEQWMAGAVEAGRDVGIEIIGVRVRTTRGARSALSRLLPEVDAVWVTSDPVVLADEKAVRALFAAIADAHKPAFTYASAFAELSPTLIVAPDVPTIGRQAAGIIQGLEPGAKKEVQSPAGSEVTLNLRAVKEYGLELNAEAMDSVNRVLR
jgi:putative tryptophan/tyrosine transport system substrate-binding protein